MPPYIKLKDPSQLDNVISKFKKDYDDFLNNKDVIEALEQNNFDKLYNLWDRYSLINSGILTVLLLKSKIEFMPYMSELVPFMFTTTTVDKLDFDYIYIPNTVKKFEANCLYLHNTESIDRIIFEDSKNTVLSTYDFDIGYFLDFIAFDGINPQFDNAANITVNNLRFGVKRGE